MIPNRTFVLERLWLMRDQIGLHVFDYASAAKGTTQVAEPPTMKEYHETDPVPGPMMTLTTAEAQGLMDELWKVGIRPAEGSGSAGSLAATQKHLDDMRRIVFHELRMPDGSK